MRFSTSWSAGLLAILLLPSVAAAQQGVWSEVPPGERWEQACAIDNLHGTMYVFGGLTYESNGDDHTYALTFDGGGQPHWTVVPTTGGPPPGRSAATMIFDAIGQRLILFGGFGNVYLNDTWALDVNTLAWTQLAPTGRPPLPRGFHSAIYDAPNQRMVLFGGFGGSLLNDTWTLSLSGTPAWAPFNTSAGPSGRQNHTAIFDGGARMYVFGGYDGAAKNDTWALSLSSGIWAQVATSGGPPAPRYAHVAIYDAGHSRMIIHGGGPVYLNDVWSLSLATLTWSHILTAPSPDVPDPLGRFFHSAAYDAANQRMLMYGGSESSILGDTWFLPLSGLAQWHALSPTIRLASHAAYDQARGRFTIFGGLAPPNNEVLVDIWAYDVAGGYWPSCSRPRPILRSESMGRLSTIAPTIGSFSSEEGPERPTSTTSGRSRRRPLRGLSSCPVASLRSPAPAIPRSTTRRERACWCSAACRMRERWTTRCGRFDSTDPRIGRSSASRVPWGAMATWRFSIASIGATLRSDTW